MEFAIIFAPVIANSDSIGEMPEWSIGAVSKTVEPFGVPRVRIPLSPPSLAIALLKKGDGEISYKHVW